MDQSSHLRPSVAFPGDLETTRFSQGGRPQRQGRGRRLHDLRAQDPGQHYNHARTTYPAGEVRDVADGLDSDLFHPARMQSSARLEWQTRRTRPARFKFRLSVTWMTIASFFIASPPLDMLSLFMASPGLALLMESWA